MPEQPVIGIDDIPRRTMNALRRLREFILALPPKAGNGQKVSSVRALELPPPIAPWDRPSSRSANAERSQPAFEIPEERHKQKPERSRICNLRWSNTTVTLGETDFVRCRFFRCKLIDDGPFSMQNCFVEDCSIQTKIWK
jgi:hypothetical protein